MQKFSKIYIAGHKGLVGSAISRSLLLHGYENLIFRTIEELDLTDQDAVNEFFDQERPEYVFLAAALVGGIMANNTFRADFIYQNIMIQSNVIFACWKYGIKKLLFLGSTCIYPKNAPQPLKEEYLLTSQLEYTNEPYAIAKIAGLKMCESFNIQYATNFISVMPTNLYGPGDNYNLEKSHVLPALLRKIHLGKCLEEENWTAIRKDLNKNPIEKINGSSENDAILSILSKYGIRKNLSSSATGQDSIKSDKDLSGITVNIWGTGVPIREFMYTSDMAEACVFVMESIDIKDIILKESQDSQTIYHPSHFLNIGTAEEISVKELAFKIKRIVGFKGEIVFDRSKPDGTMRKTTDITLLKRLGYVHKFDMENGLAEVYSDYLK
jgi:GDP-L-fucose synthase